MRTLVGMTVAAGFVLGLGASTYHARTSSSPATSLTGTWTVSLQGPAGAVSVPVSLVQHGATLTGTLTDAVTGDLELTGDISGQIIRFSTRVPGESGGLSLHFTGRLATDGTLSGDVAGPQGELQWSARRVTGQQATRPIHRQVLTPASA